MRTTAFPKAEGGRSGGPAPIEAVSAEVLAAATAADTPKTTWIGEKGQLLYDYDTSCLHPLLPPEHLLLNLLPGTKTQLT